MASLHSSLRGWNPGEQTEFDPLDRSRADALAAVLDSAERFDAEDALPTLWHWVFFQHWPPENALGADGHPAHGSFLPPIPDRRRMFAGGRVDLFHPLRVDVPTERHLSLGDVTVKTGRSGEMVFVTVRGEFRQRGAVCLVEEQDLVYRSGRGRNTQSAFDRPTRLPDSDAPWQREQVADPVRLFRFSALTANAHRIHYDAPYAREVEGYPDLVVHGPLLALWMHELARMRHRTAVPSTVRYRFHRPVFAGDPVLVTGHADARGGAELAVRTAPGHTVAEMTTSV